MLAAAATAADWMTVGLTLVLVVTTIVYAVLTGRMAKASSDALKQERTLRRREKSDRAAEACLDDLGSLVTEMDERGPSAVGEERIRRGYATLRMHAAIISDDVVRDRLLATREVLYVAGFPPEQMRREGLSPGLVSVAAHGIVRAMTTGLLTYLAERDQTDGSWDRGTDGQGQRESYPTASEAAAWIRRMGRTEG